MAFLSLTEAARALEVPQHRLIHLCEKGVVLPDGAGAHGRGSSRKFSRRNLFEFAIALEMRKLDLPVALVHAVLHVLRAFEESLRSAKPGFTLPNSLLAPRAPRLAIVILDGTRLYFSLAPRSKPQILYGGVEIKQTREGGSRKHAAVGRLPASTSRLALSEARTKIEVDLGKVAQDLPQHLP